MTTTDEQRQGTNGNGNGGDGGQGPVPGAELAGDAGEQGAVEDAAPADDDASATASSSPVEDDAAGQVDAEPLGDLDALEDPHALDLAPEAQIAESLNSALKHLRDSADKLADLPLDQTRVEAAEHIAERAAELDEQIGSIARKHDD